MRRVSVLLVSLAALLPTAVSAQSHKPTVAVVRIDDLTHSNASDQLSTMIESALAGTGKFRLIERAQLGKLVGEQARAAGGIVTTNTPGKVGGFEGVDYLVYGTITSVSAKRSDDVGSTLMAGFLGQRGAHCTAVRATLALDIKITDTRSGEIKYATHIDDSQKSATSCNGDAGIDSAALMRSAADKVANGLTTSIYPIQIAMAAPDGSLVLNYGEGTVTQGAVMAVYSKGDPIRDPASGDIIGSTETKLGLIRVSEVAARMSKATPVTAFTTAPPVGAIVRLASAEDVKALDNGTRRK